MQEALRNVRKHSQTTTAIVSIEFTTNKVKLSIIDDGEGFDLPNLEHDLAIDGKMGFIGMRERVCLIDGVLSIKSECGNGTVVRVKVACPLQLSTSRG